MEAIRGHRKKLLNRLVICHFPKTEFMSQGQLVRGTSASLVGDEQTSIVEVGKCLEELV